MFVNMSRLQQMQLTLIGNEQETATTSQKLKHIRAGKNVLAQGYVIKQQNVRKLMVGESALNPVSLTRK